MPRRAPHNQRPRKRNRPASTASASRRAPADRIPVRPDTEAPEAQGAPNLASAASIATARTVRPYQARARSTGRALARQRAAIALSKAQEYAFVREDLKRLLLTSGVLVAVMIALLFIIDR